MTVCPRCNGNGSVPYHIADDLFDETNCPLCGGSGEVITEQEYIQSCDTEQLAEFIVNLTLLDKYKLYDRMESAEYEHGIGIGAKKVIVEWLKEKHHAN